jgi:hypothetical protein
VKVSPNAVLLVDEIESPNVGLAGLDNEKGSPNVVLVDLLEEENASPNALDKGFAPWDVDENASPKVVVVGFVAVDMPAHGSEVKLN